MSESGTTFHVGHIYVTRGGLGSSTPTVDCTQKVRTDRGSVHWVVHNTSGGELTDVCVKNFTPVDTDRAMRILSGALPDDLCSGRIAAGGKGHIPGHFNGQPGDVYNYEIWVDGKLASDPQLEI